MKIENIALTIRDGRTSPEWADFLIALKNLKVGQSFVLKMKSVSNHRTAIAIGPYWLGKRFSTKRVKGGFRVGCVGLVKK